MRILITGGCGFIGSNAAQHFSALGHEVVVVDNLSRPGAAYNLQFVERLPRTRVIVGDLVAPGGAWVAAVGELTDGDAILHLAGQVAVTSSVLDPVFDFNANALATLNLLEAVRRSNRRPAVIFSSTNKVYGACGTEPLTAASRRYVGSIVTVGVSEDAPLDFHSPYGCSKGAADQYVRDYARIFGLRTVVMRQSCIYGPRQFGVEDQGWLAWFVIAGLVSAPVTIYGNGKQVRDVLFVDDLTRAFQRAVERIDDIAGEVFNVGGGPTHTLSLLELCDLLRDDFGLELCLAHAATRPGDQQAYVSDISKMRTRLGWTPQVGVAEGLRRCHDWCVEHRAEILATANARLGNRAAANS